MLLTLHSLDGKGFNFIESTSFSADASELVSQGDVIQFSDEDNNTVKATVQYATDQEGTAKTRIYLRYSSCLRMLSILV